MENESFEARSKLSLDEILSEIDELEKKTGEPERIWSMSDINDLLKGSSRMNGGDESELDADAIIADLGALEDRYSYDYEPEEPVAVEREETTAEACPEQTDGEPEREPAAEDEEPKAEDEPEKTEPEAIEPEQEAPEATDDADETPKTETEPEMGEFGQAEKNDSRLAPVITTDSEGITVISLISEPTQDSGELAAELEQAEAETEQEPEQQADEETDSEDTYTEPEPEDEQPEKPSVEELFGAPVVRYFGDGEPVQDSEDTKSNAMPGLFDEDEGENIFNIAPTPEKPAEEAPQGSEYKKRFMQVIERKDSEQTEQAEPPETIEKPGFILKRGPLSETSGLEPLPKVIPTDDFITEDDESTRIIGTPPFTNPKAAETEEQDEQLVLSGFGEEPASEQISEEELSAQIEKKRNEKKKKFVLIGKFNSDDEDEGESEDGESPAQEAEQQTAEQTEPEPEPDRVFEYEQPSDRRRIAGGLKSIASHAKTSVIGLCVLEVVALALSLVPKLFELISLDAPAFSAGGAGLAAVNLVLIIAAGILTLPTLADGFRALKTGRATCELAGGLCMAVSAVQAVVMLFNKAPVGAAQYFYSACAIFAMLLIEQGKRTDAERMMGNFKFCAGRKSEPLYAIRTVPSEKDSAEMGRPLKMDSPRIIYSARTRFPQGFIENSRSCEAADTYVKRGMIIAAAASALAALLTGIISKDAFNAISALAGTFCLTAPVSVLLTLAVPLKTENKILNRSGAMIAGYDAAKECCEADAAAVDSADLFDRTACEMHGMKDFKTVRIDDVLLYAAAVVLKSGGPLSDVFNRIISGSEELLPPVKNLLYEDKLGLSATIYGQRVLLGNRNLLVHHSIDVPLKSEEEKYKSMGRKVLYIAIESQAAAMFVINYVEDKSLNKHLQHLEENGISLVVRTDDPNITDEMLGLRFGLATKSIRLMFSHGAGIFSAYRDGCSDASPARVLHDGLAFSYFKSIAVGGKLVKFIRRYGKAALIAQIVIALGAVLALALGAAAVISPPVTILVQAVLTAAGIMLEKLGQ